MAYRSEENYWGATGEKLNDLYSTNAFPILQITKYVTQHTTHLAQKPRSPIRSNICDSRICVKNYYVIIFINSRDMNIPYGFMINFTVTADK
jgi:hypothetical protein